MLIWSMVNDIRPPFISLSVRRGDMRVVDFLKKGPATVKDVSVNIGMCIARVIGSLKYMQKLGYVTQNGNIWSLVEGVVL